MSTHRHALNCPSRQAGLRAMLQLMKDTRAWAVTVMEDSKVLIVTVADYEDHDLERHLPLLCMYNIRWASPETHFVGNRLAYCYHLRRTIALPAEEDTSQR